MNRQSWVGGWQRGMTSAQAAPRSTDPSGCVCGRLSENSQRAAAGRSQETVLLIVVPWKRLLLRIPYEPLRRVVQLFLLISCSIRRVSWCQNSFDDACQQNTEYGYDWDLPGPRAFETYRNSQISNLSTLFRSSRRSLNLVTKTMATCLLHLAPVAVPARNPTGLKLQARESQKHAMLMLWCLNHAMLMGLCLSGWTAPVNSRLNRKARDHQWKYLRAKLQQQGWPQQRPGCHHGLESILTMSHHGLGALLNPCR
jgi:hypothetical protein